MRRTFHIAWNDLRIMVGDKIFFFWTLAFPIVFIVIFGLLYKAGDNATPAAELTVVNLDQGRWGAYFVDKIKTPGINVIVNDAAPAEYNRLIVLPADFSAKIEARRDQALLFKKREDASTKAAARVETRLYQAIARVISELVLYGDGDLAKFLDAHPEFRDLVQVKTRFPANTVTVVPSGFDHSIPGTTVQFIMMMVMIYGGITVMEDRKKGVLGRMLFSPLTVGEVFRAKLLGRWLMGMLQALMLLAVGKVFFGLNLGNLPLALLVLAGHDRRPIGPPGQHLRRARRLLVAERDRRPDHPQSGHGLAGLLGHGRPAQADLLPGEVLRHPAQPERPDGAVDRTDGPGRPVFQGPGIGAGPVQPGRGGVPGDGCDQKTARTSGKYRLPPNEGAGRTGAWARWPRPWPRSAEALDSVFDPLQGFAENGPGAGEVEAHETGQLGTEHGSIAEVDAGPLQEKILDPGGLEA
jgi:hypothetical protein